MSTSAPPYMRRSGTGKKHVSSACGPCRRAHTACTVGRPCKRCISTRQEHRCIASLDEDRRDTNEPISPPVPLPSNSVAPFVMHTTTDLQVLRAGRNSAVSTGFHPHEFVNRSLNRYIHPSDVGSVTRELAALVDSAPMAGWFHSERGAVARVAEGEGLSEAELAHPIEGLFRPENLLPTRILQANGFYSRRVIRAFLGGGLGANAWLPETYGRCYIAVQVHPQDLSTLRHRPASASSYTAPSLLASSDKRLAAAFRPSTSAVDWCRKHSSQHPPDFSTVIKQSLASPPEEPDRGNATRLPPFSEIGSLPPSDSLTLAPILHPPQDV